MIARHDAHAASNGRFHLSPASRRGAAYSVTYGGSPTPYRIEEHAPWCVFLDGQALLIGRYSSLEEALAVAISHNEHKKYGV